MSTLKNLLAEHYDLNITRQHVDMLQRHVSAWELRPGHIEALNSPLLGIERMYFLTKDVKFLFDLFDIEQSHFESIAYKSDAVDPTRTVSSDVYNILTIWLVHLVISKPSQLSRQQKEMFQLNLLKLLNYKFFTSFVNYMFPHKANAEVMEYTIDNLSGKFEIKDPATSTWKLLIEARCLDIVDRTSVHYHTINTFQPDAKVLYVITDVQTRLKSRMKGIIQEFHKNHAAGKRVGSYATVSEIDGDKVINGIVSSFDQMIESICNDVLNTQKFVNRERLDIVIKITPNIRTDMMRNLLIKFSDIALQQFRAKEQMLVSGSGNDQLYLGYRILISNLIQKTYRAVILAGDVRMDSRVAILEKARNIYKSSRITDLDILRIKRSVEVFINTHSDSTRESTNASLKIAFISYLLIMSFDSL